MNLKLNKKQIFAIAVVAILVITNPSINAFKQYIGITSKNEEYVSIRRTVNGFVFSIYEYGNAGYRGKCLGVCGNFILLGEENYQKK